MKTRQRKIVRNGASLVLCSLLSATQACAPQAEDVEGHERLDSEESALTVPGLDLPTVPIRDIPPALLQSYESLFPEVARAGGEIGSGKYSAEACAEVDADFVDDFMHLPFSSVDKLHSKMGADAPCLLTNGFLCKKKKLRVNTLNVGYDLKLGNDSIARDDGTDDHGIVSYKLGDNGDEGEVLVADNITFTKSMNFEDGKTYIFVAREKIDLGNNSLSTQWPLTRGKADGKVAVKWGNESGFVDRVVTTLEEKPTGSETKNKTARTGGNGSNGPNIVLIAPTVTGHGYQVALGGESGDDGEDLPMYLYCDRDAIPAPPSCNAIGNPFIDLNCWNNEGEGWKAGKGGNGGDGGHLLIVTDHNEFAPQHEDYGAGSGGLGGKDGLKLWGDCRGPNSCNSFIAHPDQCVPEYSHRYGGIGAKGSSGTAGKKVVVDLKGKIRDFMYWFGGRAAQRDMMNARWASLNVDPDQAGSDTRRKTAIALYRKVLDSFCEDTLPNPNANTAAPHSLLPDDELLARVATCADAKARLLPMERGDNVFGLRHDLPVYADPSQLKVQRDAYLANFKDTYLAKYKAAKAASNDPALDLYNLAKQDADSAHAERVAEQKVSEDEEKRYQKAALDAWSQLQHNQKLIADESDELHLDFYDLRDSVQPHTQSIMEKASGQVGDMIKMGKALVKLVMDAYDENYFAAANDMYEFTETVAEANAFFGILPDPYDVNKELKDQIDERGVSVIGQALCQVQTSYPSGMLTELDNIRQDVNSSMQDPHRAKTLIDVMTKLIVDVDQLSRASCGLWQTFTLAANDARLAHKRVDLAKLRVQHAKLQKDLAAKLDVGALRSRYGMERDMACRGAKAWEEQVLYFDFLGARAQYFSTWSEPNTFAAKGDFSHWQLLDDASSSAYATESITGARLFDGWTAPRTSTSDFQRTPSDCDGTHETAERCAVERTAVEQLLDTGLVRVRPENGPSRFGIHTELNYGRVTAVDASLLGTSTSVRADRVAHDAGMSFVKTGSPTVNALYSPANARDLCENLQARINVMRADAKLLPETLHCDLVPAHFVAGTDVVMPDFFVWQNRGNWSEAANYWNLFGTSARGLWTLDFRPSYRELNRVDGCYGTLLNAASQPQNATLAAQAQACLGNAYLSANCENLRERAPLDPAAAAQADACLAQELPARLASFNQECSAHLEPIAGGYALLSPPGEVFDEMPVGCDRVCGPSCQALKSSITGLRLNITTRSTGAR